METYQLVKRFRNNGTYTKPKLYKTESVLEAFGAYFLKDEIGSLPVTENFWTGWELNVLKGFKMTASIYHQRVWVITYVKE